LKSGLALAPGPGPESASGSIVALLLSIGLAVRWADSVLRKRRYDVLSLTSNPYILLADGPVTFFREVNDFDTIQPGIK
jgi:hypothetical protein